MQTEKAKIRYPIPDGVYNQSSSLWYTAENGIIHLVNGATRFSASSPTTTYNAMCMNIESWIIPAGTPIKLIIDNTAETSWLFRNINNGNYPVGSNRLINLEFIPTVGLKNLFSMGTAMEGDVQIQMYVNGERWI